MIEHMATLDLSAHAAKHIKCNMHHNNMTATALSVRFGAVQAAEALAESVSYVTMSYNIRQF